MATEDNTKTLNDEIERLKEVVCNMDGLSQEGLSQISAIAGLAMFRIEQGIEHAWHLDSIYNALLVIKAKAYDTENCINGEAEDVGCDHKGSFNATLQGFLAKNPANSEAA